MAYRNVVKQDLPDSYWRLGETLGTTAVDDMGNSDGAYSGTHIKGAETLAGTGTSVSFGGGYVDTLRTGNGGAFSFTCWVKPSSIGLADERLFSNYAGSAGAWVQCQIYQSSPGLFLDDGSTVLGARDAAFDLVEDTVYFLAFTFDGSAAIVYVDGVEIVRATGTIGSWANSSNIYLANSPDGDWPYNGLMQHTVYLERALTPTEIRRHYYAGLGYTGYALEVLAHAPTAYWRFDEESGTTAADETGNHNGTINGDPALSATPLIQKGTAFGFDGTGDYVDVGSILNTGGSQPFSFAAWIQTSVTGVQNRIAGTHSDTGYYMRTDITDVLLVKMDDGTNDAFAAGSTVIADGAPHYCVMTFDGSRLKGYVDGASEIDVDASAVGDMTDYLYIGALMAGDDALRYFTGTIDEPAFFDRALTANEIRRHYYSGLGYTGYPLSILAHGPVAYWRLDETSGTIAADELGGNDGTYNGSPTLGVAKLIQKGTAVEFDGVDDYIEVSDTPFDFDTTDFTLEAWIKLPSEATFRTIFHHRDDAVADGVGYLMGVRDTGVLAAFIMDDGSSSVEVTSPSAVDDNVTHHVVARFDRDANVTLFVDAVNVAALSISTIGNIGGGSDPLRIGMSTGITAWDYFDGIIDEPVVYDRALTDAEIEEHYGVGLHGGVLYRISGTVTLDGTAGAADVRALNFATSEVIAETRSAADGTYEVADFESNADLLVVAEEPNYRPLAHGPVTPEEMN